MEENKYILYMHTNKINNKSYIGITRQTLKDRWGKNGYKYKRHKHFWNAICKYGWDNFNHDILFTNLSKERACELEKRFIAIFMTQDPKMGYNKASGGEVNEGFHLSNEVKNKLRMQKLGVKTGPHSQETKDAIARSLIGKKRSNETRLKISKARIECWKNEEYRQNQIETHKWQNGEKHPWYGKKHSQETKGKISDANTKCAVLCIELESIFKNAEEAKRQTGVDASDIRKCCKGMKKSAGKHPITGEQLHWVAVDKEVLIC